MAFESIIWEENYYILYFYRAMLCIVRTMLSQTLISLINWFCVVCCIC